jgi:hypothetical protein
MTFKPDLADCQRSVMTNAWMTICIGLKMIASNARMLFRLGYFVTGC